MSWMKNLWRNLKQYVSDVKTMEMVSEELVRLRTSRSDWFMVKLVEP